MPNGIMALRHLRRHREYYLPDGDLHLLVDDTLFCIHSYFFLRDSPLFQSWFLQAPTIGSADYNAVRIENATPQEFAKFLWVYYSPTYSLDNATTAEWNSILKIAHGYHFASIKELAIRHHATLPVVFSFPHDYASSISFFLVLPTRAYLLAVASSWSLLLFFLLKHLVSTLNHLYYS